MGLTHRVTEESSWSFTKGSPWEKWLSQGSSWVSCHSSNENSQSEWQVTRYEEFLGNFEEGRSWWIPGGASRRTGV